MPTFYPSCVINLKLKFDESLHVQPLPTPVTTDDTLGGVEKLAPNAPEPLITQPGDANTSFVLGRIPLKASIELPGYRQAGQFTLDFAFRDLPIDPRTVRAAAVEVHLGAVSAANFAQGMTGQPVDGWRPSVLQTRIDNQPNPETLVMIGTVDEWNVEHGEDRSTITIKGRDMRGILLDTPLTNDPRAAQQILEELDLSQRIDDLIRQLLGYNPLFGEFTVTTVDAEWPDGIVPRVGDPDVVPRHRRGARGQRAGGTSTPPASGSSLNFWDLVVRFCYLVGGIPYFIGTEIHIRPAHSIFDQQRAGTPLNPTPFANGQPRTTDAQTNDPISPDLRYRRLVYGRDVSSLSFDRKMGGYQRPQTVRAISVDNNARTRGAGRMIEGRWPAVAETSARRQTVAAGAQQAQENVVNVPVPGVTSEARLVQIARAVYEEIGRGEMGGTATSKNLASFGGDNADPDLLRLKPGDAVDFQVDTHNLGSRAPLVSALTDHLRTGFDEMVALVTQRLGDENLARVVVATSRGMISEIQTFFRVANVKYAWSSDSGVSVTFDFQNYVMALYNVKATSDQAGEAEGTATRTSVRSRRRPRVTTLETISIVGNVQGTQESVGLTLPTGQTGSTTVGR